ncbi:hypothetical protein ACSQ67_021495 [Phaseolus vulgaris]|uniref:Uncharacterized protein n=1 Tax=Phaseolus vulgaris TaxID=3885 RepID=V7ARY2_PHAVU|nr:hypothetical protein PHAVU_010G124600g [Phaseolus vulgaris]ESW07373.1 hypothetical protein PHAVU_010G124600g [Phaseolus vulgaris]
MAPKRRERGRRKGKSSTASTSASPSTASKLTSASAPSPSPAPELPSSPPWPVTLPEVLPAKLEGVKNYRWWKDQVRSVIVSHNLERFVVKFLIPYEYASESDRKNDIISEEYQEWLIQDQMLYTWLLSSLSEDLVPIIANCIHSWEVWNTLNEYMASHEKFRTAELRAELKNIKKTGYLAEYLERIQAIVDSLAEAGDPLTEKEHIQVILEGLPEQYNDCATVIRGRYNPPPLHNVVSLLTLQEAQVEQYNILVPVECLIPSSSSTLSDSIDDDVERPPGPPDDDDTPSSSSRYRSDVRRRGRRNRRGRRSL